MGSWDLMTTLTLYRAWWRLKSPVSRSFAKTFFFRGRSKKTTKIHVTGLCEENQSMTTGSLDSELYKNIADAQQFTWSLTYSNSIIHLWISAHGGLTATRHYPNQSWFIINVFSWHSRGSNVIANAYFTIPYNEFMIYNFEITTPLTRVNEWNKLTRFDPLIHLSNSALFIYLIFNFIVSQITKFMGPTWGPPGSCRPQMDPMLTPWTLLSGIIISS